MIDRVSQECLASVWVWSLFYLPVLLACFISSFFLSLGISSTSREVGYKWNCVYLRCYCFIFVLSSRAKGAWRRVSAWAHISYCFVHFWVLLLVQFRTSGGYRTISSLIFFNIQEEQPVFTLFSLYQWIIVLFLCFVIENFRLVISFVFLVSSGDYFNSEWSIRPQFIYLFFFLTFSSEINSFKCLVNVYLPPKPARTWRNTDAPVRLIPSA